VAKGSLAKINGLLRPLNENMKHIKIETHASGGIILTIGNEGVVLTPRKAFEMSTGILRHLGFNFEPKPPDDLPG
jgi:hypothetical protein